MAAGFSGRCKIWLADSAGGIDYDAVDWSSPSALVLGNESHGVSPDLEALADGRVRIPMPGGAESLTPLQRELCWYLKL